MRDERLERVVAVLQRRVSERAGRHDEVTARHVHGHRGHPLNTAADKLCRHALTSLRIDPQRCQEIVEAQLGDEPGSVGHSESQLMVITGGEADERDRVACEVRRRVGPRCALVGAADVGHVLLGGRDEHVGTLMAQIAAFALDAGQHVVCDLPMTTRRGRQVLLDLEARHRGRTTVVELDTVLRSPDTADVAQSIIDQLSSPGRAPR